MRACSLSKVGRDSQQIRIDLRNRFDQRRDDLRVNASEMQVGKMDQSAHLLVIVVAGHHNPQRAGNHAIVKRRRERIDFPVKCYTQTLVLRLYLQLVGEQREKILLVTQMAKQRAQGKSQQSPSARAIAYVYTQLPFIQTFSTANIQPLHNVFVVADKDERRS